jgi:hypothetical protein
MAGETKKNVFQTNVNNVKKIVIMNYIMLAAIVLLIFLGLRKKS